MVRLALAAAGLVALSAAALAQAPGKIAAACTGEYQKLCSDVKPGGGRVLKCIIAYKEQMSEACRSALREEYQKRKAAAATTGAAKQN